MQSSILNARGEGNESNARSIQVNPEIADLLRSSDPWAHFAQWMLVASNTREIKEPTAMFLATAGRSGQPAVRTVLLKGFDPSGLVFFTNYESEKARHLAENDSAEVLFYWDPLGRQIRVRGRVQKTSRKETEDYWRTRPLESQLSSSVSKQSRSVEPGVDLLKVFAEAQSKVSGDQVTCPESWGGYRLVPHQFEFWIGRSHRLHDRVRFTLSGGAWTAEQIYP